MVRSATSGAGSNVCGVAPGSFGSKELHYVLRVLSPAACHNPRVFLQVAKAVLRISFPSPPKRGAKFFRFNAHALLINILRLYFLYSTSSDKDM